MDTWVINMIKTDVPLAIPKKDIGFFGSPNQKIGQFAQSKLGDFNA